MEIHALAKRGWSISAIARHTGRDRKTVRAYLRGKKPKRKRPLSCLEREELKTLRGEVRELRRANEILKSASAFFAAELDPRRTK